MILAYFRRSFERHITLLLLSSVLAALLSVYAAVEPRVRLSPETLLRALLATALVFLILGALHLFFLLLFGPSHAQEIKDWAEDKQLDSPALNLGASLSQGISQEFLLRGYVFSGLLLFSPLVAYGVNVLLSFLLHFSGRQQLRIAFLRAIEGSIYALMYASNRSLAMIAITHVIVDYGIHYSFNNTSRPWINHALSFRQQRFAS